jgi:intein/homing endonuclease
MSLDLTIDSELELRRRKREGIILNAPPAWDDWLYTLFPKHFTAPFAQRHVEFWEWVESIEKGIRPRPFVGIWGRGGAKCLDENSEILLSDGTRRAIRDICIGDTVISYNEKNGKMEIDHITNKWHSGIKLVRKIITKSRKEIILTADHFILTFNGWKRAGDITTDDRIASPRKTTIQSWIKAKDEEIRFLGYMLAEGGTSLDAGCRWTNADPVIISDFIHCANSMGFHVKPSGEYGYYVGGAARWVENNGMRGKYAKNKRIPQYVYGLPDNQKWMFLASIIDTDGWIQSDRGRIGITLASHGMITDLQYIFTQLGVVTTIYEKPNDKAGAWALVVANEYVRHCYENLPLRLKGEKLKKSLNIKRYSLLDVYPASVAQNLPRRMNRRIRNTSGMKLGNSRYDITRDKIRRAIGVEYYEPWIFLENAEVFWDRVIEIKDAGMSRTYDVEIGRNHNMIADGLVTHNSTNAEAAAIRLAAKRVRKYAWYISSIQEKADQHVDTIGAMLEDSQTNKYYPDLSDRAVNKFGNSKGWRRSRLRTASGFTIDALGLDTGARGAKIDEQRPDLIIVDDVDDLFDTFKTTQKKIQVLTQSILPAGSIDCAVLFIQNLIHSDSIASRLADGRADFLTDRIVSGPHPAVIGLVCEQIGGRFIIKAGIATWEGQSLATCQEQILTWGYTAFIKESQHDVTKSGGVWDHIEFNHIEFTDLPEFTRTAVWVDPAVSETDESDSMGISAAGITRKKQIIGIYWWEGITSPEDAIERAILKAIEIHATHVGIETDQGGDTWRSVYARALEKVKEKLRKQLSHDRFSRIVFPKFTSRKAGGTDESTGHAYGSKVERNFKMLSDYERGMVTHMIGTHATIEKALWRFPKSPLDVADSWYWTWQDLRNGKIVSAM